MNSITFCCLPRSERPPWQAPCANAGIVCADPDALSRRIVGQTQPPGVVVTPSVAISDGPGTGSPSGYNLNGGTKVNVIDQQGEWVRLDIVEVERILAPGGVFLTQQVDGRNLSDLSVAFDTEQLWTYFTLEYVLEQIAKTDLVVELAQDWNGTAVFKDVGVVVYYLKAVPWIVPKGFSVTKYQEHLQKLQERLEQEEKLTFLQTLFMVKVRKAG